MPEEIQIRREVREILDGIVIGDEKEWSDDDDIFAAGMDSVSTLLLITEIENRYSLTFTADEIPYEQLSTISGIASFVVSALDSQRPANAGV